MPVLFNKESGLAENLPDQEAHGALEAGSHEVPLIDPNGALGSAPRDAAQSLIAQGFQQPTPEQLQGLLTKAKYSTTPQQLIGAAEQVAQGVAGPIPAMVEKALGVPEEDIRGRAETKGAGEKMLEQGLGLVGSAFIPGGQARVLEKAGELGVQALKLPSYASELEKAAELGLKGEEAINAAKTAWNSAKTFDKVGSAAARAAIENVAFQAGEEAQRAILNDPEATAGHALANIGLAGVLGAGVGTALGVVPPIWQATLGPKAESFLRAITNRANGEAMPISEELNTVLKNMARSGKEIPPELRAGLSDNPLAQDYFRELRESGTTTGDALRQTIDQFKGDVGDQLRNVFQEEGAMTAFEAGEKAKDKLYSKVEELNDRVSANYDRVNPDREAILIGDEDRLKAYNKMLAKATEEFGTDSPQYSLFKNYGDRLLARDTIGKIDKLRTELMGEIKSARSFASPDFEKARALGMIRDTLSEFQDSQIGKSGAERFMLEGMSREEAAAAAKNLVNETQVARDSYKKFIGEISNISSLGKMGKVHSFGQFTEALDKIPSAKLAEKLFDPKNIEGLRYLAEEHPEVMDAIIKAKKTAMIESATTKGELMHNQLLNNVNKLPREVRDLMFSKEEQDTINASGKILRESAKRINPSGTGTALDKIMANLPAGAGAMASLLFGHNPVVGFLLGHAGKFLGRDMPDAAKASLLKFLGSPEVIEGSAWKSMADYFHAAQRGEAMLKKAAKGVIKAGQEVMPMSQMPDEKTREKLDKKLLAYRDNPEKMLDLGGKIGHYAPDHASAIGGIAANVVNYLNGMRPTEIQVAPLDTPFELPFKRDRYDTALDVAQQPLVVLNDLKDGIMTQHQVDDLKAMYPKLYDSMSQQLTEQIIAQKSAGEDIPYKTQIGLSLFLGTPLDSSMTQLSLQSLQLAQGRTNAKVEAQQQNQAQGGSPPAKTMKPLSKMGEGYATASQAREAQRQSPKV